MNHAIILNSYNRIDQNEDKPDTRRPIGAHRIATWLRKQDWDVEVLDFLLFWSIDELKEFFQSRITNKTVFIGISGTFYPWADHLYDFFSWFRKTYPDVKIVVGGQNIATMPLIADYYIDGYAEHAISAVIKNILGTEDQKLKWQFWRNGKKLINAIHDYPAYPMNDLSVIFEHRDFIGSKEWVGIEVSRGCKFKCSFCNYPILGVKGDYSRDADNFYNDLKRNYDSWGIQNYYIADETFNDRSEKIIKFADAVEKLDFNPFFMAFIRADLMIHRPQDWQHMARMGLFGHWYGIESINPKTAKAVGKGMNPQKLTEGLIEIKEYFSQHGPYTASTSWIVGLPYETKETFLKTLQWIAKNWHDQYASIWPLSIIPDSDGNSSSEISKDYKKYGYRPSSVDLDNYLKGKYQREFKLYHRGFTLDQRLNWENDHMDLTWAIEQSMDYLINQSINHPITGWGLGDILPFTDLTLQQATKTSVKEFDWNSIHQNQIIFIKKYIHNKLNWR